MTRPRSPSLFAALLGAMVGIALAGGCGRENVVLLDDLALRDDAGTSPTLGDASPSTCDASTRTACRALDALCTSPSECCSGRCEQGTCAPPGACLLAGSACGARTDCCSGRCEPVPGTTNRACTNICRSTGAACAKASDCCSFGCIGGTCATTACKVDNDDCGQNGECCSNQCVGGRCRIDAVVLCRATGEDCNSGGGTACCYGCTAEERCDVGPGQCRPRNAPCERGSDCCVGTCSPTHTCGDSCSADGADCTSASDCCSGSCTSSPGKCVPAAASTCASIGAACATSESCCTGSCIAGICADICAGPH